MVNLAFTREQAAEALTVSLRTIDLMISRGDIHVRRIGRRVIVPRSEIERLADLPIKTPKTIATVAV